MSGRHDVRKERIWFTRPTNINILWGQIKADCYIIIYASSKILDSDTKYQSLPYERLACQAYA